MEGGVEADTYTPDLPALRRMFTEAQTETTEARRESQIDDDYYHGFQWTAEERRALAKRKQPDLVFNRVRPAVNGTLGVIKQGATDPRAYPRNPQDQEASDVASKVLRYIADYADFDALKIDAAKAYLVEGTCAAIVEVGEDQQITVTPIRWEEFFYDPRSRRQDFGDARYMGVAKWQYADDVAAMYPDAKKAIDSSLEGSVGGVEDSFSDRPTSTGNTVAWVDGKKRRVMVVEIYHREGKAWRRCVFHSGGVLESGDSPYVDRYGQPMNPIEAQSCFVDRENNRYGIVRDMRGPQDEINKRRSKLLHLVSMRQVQEAQPGMGMGDAKEVREEASRPDGVLPSGWQVVPTQDMAAGQAQLLAEAKAEIERMGPNPAILGRQGESQSGRSALVRQQAGLTEQAVIFGGIEEWELRIYRQMWQRARQFWRQPMFIRITDDEGKPEFQGVNGAVDPNAEPKPPVMLGELDVDIIVSTVPDTANVQQEQFAMLAELAKVGALGPNAGPLLLEASSLPNKQQVLDKLKGQAEQPNPMQELQVRGAAAKVAETEANANLKNAQAKSEAIDGVVKAAGLMPPPPPPVSMPAAGVIPGVTPFGA